MNRTLRKAIMTKSKLKKRYSLDTELPLTLKTTEKRSVCAIFADKANTQHNTYKTIRPNF